MTAQKYRYHLPKKAIKGDCPDCSPRHRKTLSRFVDGQTGEPLPEQFGRCDRESNCGYFLSPYDKGSHGISYADEVFEQMKANSPFTPSFIVRPATKAVQSPPPIHALPDEVFKKTLGDYENNRFATLLRNHFGLLKADELLRQFQIGTSAYWPGATVFWVIDSNGRTRGGQVNLFSDDWHRAKYIDSEGKEKACISSISKELLRPYKWSKQNAPDWLNDYDKNADRWPVPFGLHQLRDAPADKPVAIVEACKTAVVCSGHFPDYVWLAIGAKSYTQMLKDWQNLRAEMSYCFLT